MMKSILVAVFAIGVIHAMPTGKFDQLLKSKRFSVMENTGTKTT